MQGIDTRALVSIITGVAALMFLFSFSWTILCVPLGGVALWTGVGVLRAGRPGMGLSVGGVVLGTIAICGWLITKLA